MQKVVSLVGMLAVLGGCSSAAEPESTGDTSSAIGAPVRYTAAQLLAANSAPLVIGHEGDGENFAQWPTSKPTDPTRPINDTVASVAFGYANGASMVEIDAELTKDGQIVAYHDFDFLPDYTCINTYTVSDLRRKVPYIATLDEILLAAHVANLASPHLSGILMIELKTPSPLCDPGDVEEQPLVQAVVNAVHRNRMDDAVMFDGFSPNLVAIAAQLAPNVPRELDLDLLQLLTPEQVTGSGYSVTPITKAYNPFGLQWAEVGPAGGPAIYRLPGYSGVTQFFGTAVGAGASIVDAEEDFIGTAGAAGVAQFVGAAHSLGMKAYADPAHTTTDFATFAGLGFDGAYCDDIKGSLTLQPKF